MLRATLSVVACLVVLALPAIGAVSIVGYGSISATVDPIGYYTVTLPEMAWNFAGSVGAPVSNLQTGFGADALGGFREVSFEFVSGSPRRASIRIYTEQPAVLFIVSCPSSDAANTFNFPSWGQYPRNLDHLTFSGIFAPPTSTSFAADSPWIFFDAAGKTFILSPAANFMTAATTWNAAGEMSSGISSEIEVLPRGFEHRTLLVAAQGVNRAFDTWGRALTSLNGKLRPANDADVTLNQVGYWTDNGAPYYYQMADRMNYEQTLTAVKGDFERAGIKLGYLQLDSWFYPKGKVAMWSNNGAGIYRYEAAAPPFASGLARFQQNLGVPLVTHARWIDDSSPYRTLYKMSGNVVTDPAYWDSVAAWLALSGVATYEQDWLADKAQADFNLTDGAAFLDNMAAAMERRRLSMQYCMAAARHYLQSSKYSNLTTIRTSADRLHRDRWLDFLYASRLASAVGAWPFADNFRSTETSQLLLATLSAGPLGIADPIGALNGANLLHAVRRDGVIVKPDVPLMPTGASYTNMARNAGTPQVAYTWSDFDGLRTHYVFAFTHGTQSLARFSPSDLGITSPVYVYDYFGGTGRLVAAGDAIEIRIAGEQSYLVLAPVGPSGIAILGDTEQFVTMGRKRVAEFSDHGAARVTVAFAAGETARTVTGYSPVSPIVLAFDGSAGPVAYDPATQLFQVPVMPGENGTATIRLHNPRRTDHREAWSVH